MNVTKLSTYLRLIGLVLFGGNLATLSLLTEPRRARDYLLRCLFDWRLVAGRGIERRDLWELFDIHSDLNIIIDKSATLNYIGSRTVSHGMDIVYLCMITRAVSPRTVFEIGTYLGVSALHFALNTPEDSQIYTLDLEPERMPILETTVTDRSIISATREVEPVFTSQSRVGHKIHRFFGDSAEFDFSPYYGQIDLFFIDGAHSYAYVKSDSENALLCCHKGSVIVWHDYGRFGVNGVTRYLNALTVRRPVYRLPGSSLAILRV